MRNAIKCFLIDDDEDDQEIFLMALKAISNDINCLFADNAVEGLKKLSENTAYLPDYIFIDVNIPRMNGMQCLPEIKKLEHLSNAKLIMFSTAADPKVINASKVLGATEFLIKPTSFNGLILALTDIMKS